MSRRGVNVIVIHSWGTYWSLSRTSQLLHHPWNYIRPRGSPLIHYFLWYVILKYHFHSFMSSPQLQVKSRLWLFHWYFSEFWMCFAAIFGFVWVYDFCISCQDTIWQGVLIIECIAMFDCNLFYFVMAWYYLFCVESAVKHQPTNQPTNHPQQQMLPHFEISCSFVIVWCKHRRAVWMASCTVSWLKWWQYVGRMSRLLAAMPWLRFSWLSALLKTTYTRIRFDDHGPVLCSV